jgi:ADP-heptose:LPS heptosyltransferase
MKSAADFFALTRDARRVLVIDPGVLGDTVHRLPALWELRRNYPSAELHVLCSPVGAEVLELAGCADKLWILDQARERRSLAGQWRVLRALRRLRFDVSLNFGDNDRNVIYAAWVSARHRLGLRRDRWHFWSRWCIGHWVWSPGRGLPVWEQRRQMLAAAGFPLAEPRFGLRPPAAAKAWAEANVPPDAIHFSLSASTHLKEWPLTHWIELARRCRENHPCQHLVITAAPNEREQKRLRAFIQAFAPGTGGDDAWLRTFTGLSIPQLAALLARCSRHVGADSGVLHLAAALGVPTVGLFRRYPRLAEWLPRRDAHRHCIADCDCARLKQDLCAQRDKAECLAALSPAAVEQALWPALSAETTRPDSPRLTVAICTRNRAVSLERAIRSVLAQLGPDEELLVVDDGSTDDTPRRLAALTAEQPRLRVCRKDVSGIAAARNHALAQARSECVLFLDDDETAEPGWLAAYRAFLAAPPGLCLGAVGGPYVAEFETPPPWWLDDGFGGYDHRGELRALDGRLTLPGGNCLFFKTAVAKAGGFAEDLERGEDSELNLRLRDAGYETWWLPAARIRHHLPASRLRFAARMTLAWVDGRSVARLRLRRCGTTGKRIQFAAGRCLAVPFQCLGLGLGAAVLSVVGRRRRATFDLTRALRAGGIGWELLRRPGQVFSTAPSGQPERRGNAD